MDNSNNTIMIAEDDFKIRQMITLLLNGNDFNVIQAKDGEEALEVFYQNKNKIDLILLDVMMPNRDGFSVLKEIRKEYSTPIIMLTAKDQEYDEIQGFSNGADDYISKPFSPTILLARIQSVLRRINKDSNEIEVGNITINKENKDVFHNGKIVDFTSEEREILLYLIKNEKKVVCHEEIFKNIWNFPCESWREIVDTNIRNIKEKLKDDSKYIKIVHGAGYIFEVE